MKKVCYYVMGHPLLSKNIGGAEIQLHYIGKELQSNGWETHYIVDDEGKDFPKEAGGQFIHPIKSFRKSKYGLLRLSPYLLANTLFTYNRPDFDGALDQINPDIVHQRGSSIVTGYFASWAERNNKPFVFSIAHIDDCTLKGNLWAGISRQLLKKRLYLYGLSKARIIIATADYLKEAMGKLLPDADIRVIRSGHPMPNEKPKKKDTVVWVSRAVSYKFPGEFISLAKKLPQYNFEMIGGITEHEEFESVMARTGKLDNLHILGFLPQEQVNNHISEAKLLVDTSDSAGFPNTFIQAWLRHATVVSLSLDPDELLSGAGVGVLSGSPEKLTEDVRQLMENERERKGIAKRAFKYAKRNHDIKRTGEAHLKLYREII
ncbi:MAG: glycosyltransferase family 4 protein [Candidatus Micrarchaeota archaeon]